jgi:hypothetical protein
MATLELLGGSEYVVLDQIHNILLLVFQGVRGFLTTCPNFVVIVLHKIKLFMLHASHHFVLICPLNVKLICKNIYLSLLGITYASRLFSVQKEQDSCS